jgi:hypothetical protein
MEKYQPKTDYEAFCKLKELYGSELPVEDISDIWQFTHGQMPFSSSSLERFQVACRKLDELLGPRAGTGQHIFSEDYMHSIATTEDSSVFTNFILLCEDLFHFCVLEDIWSDVHLEGISEEERFDLAVMTAIERFSEQGEKSIVDEQVAILPKSKDDQKLSLPLFNGGRKLRRKDKRNKIISSQQAVVDMLEDTFRGTPIPTALVHEVAAVCNYDPEESLNQIWREYLRRHSVVQDGVSFADIAAVPASVGSNLSFIVASRSTTDAPSEDEYLSSAASKSLRQSDAYHRFADHFLVVAQRSNPSWRIRLDSDRLLSFDGPIHDVTGEEKGIRVDLHGLTVLRALELVESVLNYVYRLSAQTRGASLVQNSRYLMQFIVGRGAHSSRGVAKLKPAVEHYFRSNGEHDMSTMEGEVHVRVNLSTR